SADAVHGAVELHGGKRADIAYRAGHGICGYPHGAASAGPAAERSGSGAGRDSGTPSAAAMGADRAARVGWKGNLQRATGGAERAGLARADPHGLLREIKMSGHGHR